MGVFQLDLPSQQPCLVHIAMCSALCNESSLQYNPDKGAYEKIGESTEVALRVLAEKVAVSYVHWTLLSAFFATLSLV